MPSSPPLGFSPHGRLPGRTSRGQTPPGGSETQAGEREGGGGEEGRGRRAKEGRWEEGLLRCARRSGGSALPRSVHLGESCNVERSSGPRAATAMRGARGAWDFLGVLLLLGLQTGGRAQRAPGSHPLSLPLFPRAPTRWGVSGEVAAGSRCPCVFSLREDWRRLRDSPARSASLTCGRSPRPLVVGALSWGLRGKRATKEVRRERGAVGGRGLHASLGLLLCGGCAGAEAGESGVCTQSVISAVRGAAVSSFC